MSQAEVQVPVTTFQLRFWVLGFTQYWPRQSMKKPWKKLRFWKGSNTSLAPPLCHRRRLIFRTGRGSGRPRNEQRKLRSSTFYVRWQCCWITLLWKTCASIVRIWMGIAIHIAKTTISWSSRLETWFSNSQHNPSSAVRTWVVCQSFKARFT